MFCPNCGKEYENASQKFCDNCGYSLTGNSSTDNQNNSFTGGQILDKLYNAAPKFVHWIAIPINFVLRLICSTTITVVHFFAQDDYYATSTAGKICMLLIALITSMVTVKLLKKGKYEEKRPVIIGLSASVVLSLVLAFVNVPAPY